VLTSAADAPLARRLAEHLGYNVQTWRRVEGPSSAAPIADGRLAEVAQQIIGEDADRVFVLRTEGGLEVFPYEVPEPV
jgi:hypothetical protein